MDSRFCSLTARLKNEKIQKDKVQSVKDWKNTHKNTKIQIAFLDAMEKYKKNTKIQSVFFIFYLYFSYFLYVYQKKRKNAKKNTKNTNAIAQKYKIQKKYESTISKIQNTKKNTNPKFQKYKIQRKDKFKNKPESQPRVHFWKSGTKIQKNTKPTSCIFQSLQF